MSFCAPVDRRPRLAVLGIFSAEENQHLRSAIRKTWLHSGLAAPDGGILSRFVVRGVGAGAMLRLEIEAKDDTVSLEAKSSLNRRAGPLASLMLWLQCALGAWPLAQLVGKADDDVWASLSGAAALLRGALDATRRELKLPSTSSVQLYWGMMETYSWDLKSQRPFSFAYKWGRSGEPCSLRHYEMGATRLSSTKQLVERPILREVYTGVASRNVTPRVLGNGSFATYGPFHFAKGPMLFVSARLASNIIQSAAVRLWKATMDTTNQSSLKGSKPWEDVWLGLALSLFADDGALAAVHMGMASFSEGAGAPHHPTEVAWHAGAFKSGVPQRILARHNLTQCKRSYVPALNLRCSTYVACSGASWLRCLQVNNFTQCP